MDSLSVEQEYLSSALFNGITTELGLEKIPPWQKNVWDPGECSQALFPWSFPCLQWLARSSAHNIWIQLSAVYVVVFELGSSSGFLW